MSGIVRVSAAVVVDEDGRALVVRKRGARVFQQPGGKPDPGETPLETVVREVAEETGIHASPADFVPLGRFSEVAANEPDHQVVADAFLLRVEGVDATSTNEIEELRWLREEDVEHTPLAPLSRNHLIRFAWA
ncbi:NUDIX domain-containing protein [Microbacterium sediminicola]|uniref:NUDIX domain-containing protein n=1 Tax=Microbacterium sediminicola TaxID=415210 RepID=A0ABP4THS8_9MICO